LKVSNLKDMYETDELEVPVEGEQEVEAEDVEVAPKDSNE